MAVRGHEAGEAPVDRHASWPAKLRRKIARLRGDDSSPDLRPPLHERDPYLRALDRATQGMREYNRRNDDDPTAPTS